MDSATRLQTILVDSPVGSVLPAICKQQRVEFLTSLPLLLRRTLRER
ncbi:MAG TPA: hypothetical protein V6C91_01840 [Coleofasciculaceae cyanobacterium]